jgi:hypothetical protein
MNKLYVGLTRNVELRKGGLLLINEVGDVREWRFDPLKHSFDPLKGIDYRKAVALVDAVMAVMPGGENTLTKEDAEYILLEALLSKPRSLERLIEKSKDPAREKARRMIDRLFFSPLIRRVLCGKTNFTFNPNLVNMARINRAELGDFDSRVLGLLLMSHFKGQLVVPDLGFYGRASHVSLVREYRLIGGQFSRGAARQASPWRAPDPGARGERRDRGGRRIARALRQARGGDERLQRFRGERNSVIDAIPNPRKTTYGELLPVSQQARRLRSRRRRCRVTCHSQSEPPLVRSDDLPCRRRRPAPSPAWFWRRISLCSFGPPDSLKKGRPKAAKFAMESVGWAVSCLGSCGPRP